MGRFLTKNSSFTPSFARIQQKSSFRCRSWLSYQGFSSSLVTIEVIKYCTKLESIRIHNGANLTDKSLDSLAKVSHLKQVFIKSDYKLVSDFNNLSLA